MYVCMYKCMDGCSGIDKNAVLYSQVDVFNGSFHACLYKRYKFTKARILHLLCSF